MRYLIALLAALLAAPAFAQGGLFSMESREDGRGWEAVGRLEIGGKAFCTGALIAPDLVLTAAHCLFDSQSGARVPVEQIQFLAGWRNGRAAAYRRVRRALSLDSYDFKAPASPERVRSDLAVIELQLPIRNSAIAPFGLGPFPEAGAPADVLRAPRSRLSSSAALRGRNATPRSESILPARFRHTAGFRRTPRIDRAG